MENDILETIGPRMAEIRRSHRVTQEALAELLDISPKHVSHCENSTSCFSLKNMIQFCSIFNCSLDYLVFGKDSNESLAKLPDEIVKVLNTGSSADVERLNRYLQIYVELLQT